MTVKDRLRKLLGIGQERPQSPLIDENRLNSIRLDLSEELARNTRAQTELQLRSLDDIDHSLGVRMAIDGTLRQLKRDG